MTSALAAWTNEQLELMLSLPASELGDLLGRMDLDRRSSTLSQLRTYRTPKERAEEHLAEYCKQAWALIEPSRTPVWNWHMDVICLPYDSKITTEAGEQSIGHIVESGWSGHVLSVNHESGQLEWRRIARGMKSPGKCLINIATTSGDVLSVTENHPVFVFSRGYIQAREVQTGDEVAIVHSLRTGIHTTKQQAAILLAKVPLRSNAGTGERESAGATNGVQALWENVLPVPVSATRRFLQYAMLRVAQDATGPILQDLRIDTRQADWAGNVRGVLPQETKRPTDSTSLPPMRFDCLQETFGRYGAARSLLQSQMLRPIRHRQKQPGVYRWTAASDLPSRLSTDSEVHQGEGWRDVLSLSQYEAIGRTSHRPGSKQQRGMELSDALPCVSQWKRPTQEDHWGVRRATVCRIEREVRIPESVYNLEVESNHNYFASGILVHNCDHLEMVSRGEIRNLLINIPPGCSKSLLVSSFWPSWEWGPAGMPDSRFMCVSYDQELSTRDSIRCRKIIDSPWYQENWGDRFGFTKDQNLKTLYANTKTGYRLATTIGGHATGEHPTRVIVDDPHNVKKAESAKDRQTVKDWWDLTMSTRGVALGVRYVIIMQRLKVDDLTGYILDKEGERWTVLCFPMRYESNHPHVSYAKKFDPRREEGELLSPNYMTEDIVNEVSRKLGSYGTAGQFQQRPAPREGGLFRRAWFHITDGKSPCHVCGKVHKIPDPSEYDEVCRFWDKAGSELEGDFTAGPQLARCNSQYYWTDLVHGQWSAGERDNVIDQTAKMDDGLYGVLVHTRFEQEPASGGKQSAEISLHNFRGHRVSAEPATGSQLSRVEQLAIEAENYGIIMVKAPWNEKALDELCTFPNADHDDIVLGAGGAYRYLARPQLRGIPPRQILNAVRLLEPSNPKSHPYTAVIGAVSEDERERGRVALAIVGVNVQDRRMGLMALHYWDRKELNVADRIAEVCREYRPDGVAFNPSVSVALGELLFARDLPLYETLFTTECRRSIAQTAVNAFNGNYVDLYRDEVLLRQLGSLVIDPKPDGHILGDPTQQPLRVEAATAFVLALHWASGTLQDYLDNPDA